MRNYSLTTTYQVFKQLIELYTVLNRIEYIVTDNAPNTFKAMKQWHDDHGYLNVYSGGDHGLLGYKHNVMFRAVHDHMHLKYNLKFTKNDELTLSDITCQVFNDLALAMGYDSQTRANLVKLIDIEIAGQIKYYYKYNDYVKDQSAFIIEQWG
jgi:hypothetical protein